RRGRLAAGRRCRERGGEACGEQGNASNPHTHLHLRKEHLACHREEVPGFKFLVSGDGGKAPESGTWNWLIPDLTYHFRGRASRIVFSTSGISRGAPQERHSAPSGVTRTGSSIRTPMFHHFGSAVR